MTTPKDPPWYIKMFLPILVTAIIALGTWAYKSTNAQTDSLRQKTEQALEKKVDKEYQQKIDDLMLKSLERIERKLDRVQEVRTYNRARRDTL